MRLLILGGTGFIGPHMVEYALSRGHTVTMFNRGRSNTHLFPDVEKLVGDRNGDVSALEGREWDVVLDNNATLPSWVRRTAQLLKDSAAHYIHVSTISVYAGASFAVKPERTVAPGSPEEEARRIHEDSELMVLPDGQEGEEVTGATYGPFKVLAEEEARRAFPGRAAIVRPGLIVGPGDPTDRFTYWPVRVDRGGEVLAPGDGLDSVQIIDARDLTGWIVRLAVEGVSGTYNATGPEARLSLAEMVYGIRAVTSSSVQLQLGGHGLPSGARGPTLVQPAGMDPRRSYGIRANCTGSRPGARFPVFGGDDPRHARVARGPPGGRASRPPGRPGAGPGGGTAEGVARWPLAPELPSPNRRSGSRGQPLGLRPTP